MNIKSNLIDRLETIYILSEVIDRITTERAHPEAPEWTRNDCFLGGLNDAIRILSRDAIAMAEKLPREQPIVVPLKQEEEAA